MERSEMKQEELQLPKGTAAILLTPDGKAEMLLPKVESGDPIPENVYVAGLIFMALHKPDVMNYINNYFNGEDNAPEKHDDAAA